MTLNIILLVALGLSIVTNIVCTVINYRIKAYPYNDDDDAEDANDE